MSRGHGAIEAGTLKVLARHHANVYTATGSLSADMTLHEIVARLDGKTNSLSVRRALNALEHEGLIKVTWPGTPTIGRWSGTPKKWALKKWKPSAEDRRQREANHEEILKSARRGTRQRKAVRQREVSTIDRLAKILAMLSSPEPGERDNAARMAEEERKRLGKSWDDLLRRR
jgi:predicted ArsR family transcriptional regulator